ncbi:chemosensory protein 18 precursor [Tribolium castaneum]|uniref:Chemosensory protein 18 n=1 Tax=Tribolium castaneum TaxID=7070 RepID=Q0MRK5_TRICA|nr:chemosensory protein 18 precursor [Tribolium castaneum]ABH88191.1 chemosensory protein 18 [Tribolium castaneum]EFA07417.1 chemosensory protein 3 [Tribolium castaneum]|eukprot:NP_001039286.1 chemosensory protein 18 precursor [Tribolium castaneum]
MLFTVFLVLTCAHVVFLEEYVIPDNIDIDDILSNERLLKNYVNCLLDKGRCTPEGKKLKSTIPEALSTDCAKCNEKVKANVRKVLHHLIDNKPDMWKQLEAKYDPSGEYRSKYKDELEKNGIHV